MRARGIVVAAAVTSVAPLLLAVTTAFTSPDQFARDGIGVPSPWTLDNFARLVETPSTLAIPLLVTALAAAVIAVAQTVSSVLAAYALVCLRMPGRRILGAVFLAAYATPPAVTAIPLHLVFARAGLTGTFWALVLPFALASPYAVFLLAQWMRQVPRELLDAAEVDGAGPTRVLWEVVVPMVRPAIAAVAVIAAVSVWNSYLWPRLAAGVQLPQIQVAIASLQSQYDSNWTLVMAAVGIAIVPPALALIPLHRVMTLSPEGADHR